MYNRKYDRYEYTFTDKGKTYGFYSKVKLSKEEFHQKVQTFVLR